MRSPETPSRLLLGAALLLLSGWALRWTRVVVSGGSMAPTLQPGDRLLVRRGRRAPIGSLVVVRAPGGREVVKRLVGRSGDVVSLGADQVRLGAGEVAVLGDCPPASTDSRSWGPLPNGAVRGRVTAIYHPPDRARRCPSRAMRAGRR